MMNWREGIEEFDRDLEKRMKVIARFEITGYSSDSPYYFRRLLGFVTLSNPCWFFNKNLQWDSRNRERKNLCERIRRARIRVKNPEFYKEQYRLWYASNRDVINMRRRARARTPTPPPPHQGQGRTAPNEVSGPPLTGKAGVDRSCEGQKVLRLGAAGVNESQCASDSSTLSVRARDRQ